MKSKNEPVQMQIIFEVSIFRKRKKKKEEREKFCQPKEPSIAFPECFKSDLRVCI